MRVTGVILGGLALLMGVGSIINNVWSLVVLRASGPVKPESHPFSAPEVLLGLGIGLLGFLVVKQSVAGWKRFVVAVLGAVLFLFGLSGIGNKVSPLCWDLSAPTLVDPVLFAAWLAGG